MRRESKLLDAHVLVMAAMALSAYSFCEQRLPYASALF